MSQPVKPATPHQQQQPPQQQFKTRKRETVVKYEPSTFRDQLLTLIPAPCTFQQFQTLIEQNAEKLELKRYGELFFELLIVGGLLTPGGNIGYGSKKLEFSCFESPTEELKSRVEFIGKLVRRYKYLQIQLEDTMGHILPYANKFGENTVKLATFTGYLLSNSTIPATVLNHLLKDHLVKDSTSLTFLTLVFKSFLTEQTIDQLSNVLRKSGIDNKLMEFFPESKRQDEYFARHFEGEGLKSLVDYFKKKQQGVVKEKVKASLKEMFENDKSSQEIVTFAKQQLAAQKWNETDFIELVWDAFITSVDWSTRPDQMEGLLQKELTTHGAVFENLCTMPKTEIKLLQKVQVMCFEDARFLRLFKNICMSFYKSDVVSASALLYWYEKGAVVQGKTTFLKQMEGFIVWLKKQEEEESEEDEE
ncbi:hypothetical protein HK098_005511 [Nowakowskiella sp. JEL0407]|nr:hypothetical protein HK098_005511 [Nowakowskiella sp. JEL0407]